MFDKYIVCEEGFRRLDDGRTGGRIEVRMPYYRGLGLSMVEAVNLVLDGIPVPPERTTFTVHGHTYTFAELPGVIRRPVGDGGAGGAGLRDRQAAHDRGARRRRHDPAAHLVHARPRRGADRKRLTLGA